MREAAYVNIKINWCICRYNSCHTADSLSIGLYPTLFNDEHEKSTSLRDISGDPLETTLGSGTIEWKKFRTTKLLSDSSSEPTSMSWKGFVDFSLSSIS